MRQNNVPDERWLFFTDAPPCPGAAGCHFVARNFCHGLPTGRTLVLTRRFSRRFPVSQLRTATPHPVVLWKDSSPLALGRISRSLRSRVDLALFHAQLGRLSQAIESFGATRIFALSGADFYFLPMVAALASRLHLPVDLYLVDDFLASALANGDRPMERAVRKDEKRLLAAATRVWTISEGYARHLEDKHGCRASFLPVPMPVSQITYAPFPGGIRKLVFIGSVNHLYIDALVDIYETISQLNTRGSTPPYRMALYTLARPDELIARLPDTRFLDIELASSDAARAKGLRESFAVLLPYSFREENRLMVSTSFSCKTGEALAAGRPILVYGPPCASVPSYFLKNGLPLVVTNQASLENAISTLESHDNRALIERYAMLAQSNHAPEAVVARLAGATPEIIP